MKLIKNIIEDFKKGLTTQKLMFSEPASDLQEIHDYQMEDSQLVVSKPALGQSNEVTTNKTKSHGKHKPVLEIPSTVVFANVNEEDETVEPDFVDTADFDEVCHEDGSRLQFKVHSNIIHDLIHSQNGTVATAIRELVMNAIDAGSKRCEITLTNDQFSVKDWGKGFSSEAEIKKYFQNFGEPHKDGDAIHGRFRIGRGQAMAFGAVTWTSKQYSMSVDIKRHGYSFDFKDHGNMIWDGCRVDGNLYESLKKVDIYLIKDALQEFIRFADVAVLFNGECITQKMDSIKWDIEEESFCIKWDVGRHLKLYSQGVFVKDLRMYEYGFNGLIVTKQALKLNMARNEISEVDPLWVEIHKQLQAKTKEKIKKKASNSRISEETRRTLVRHFLSGGLDPNLISDSCFFKDCRGHSISINQIIRNQLPLTVSPEENSKKADQVATAKIATVLALETLHEFGVESLESLQHLVINTLEHYDDFLDDERRFMGLSLYMKAQRLVDFESVSEHISNEQKVLNRNEYSDREAAARAALHYASTRLAMYLSGYYGKRVAPRSIKLGQSHMAEAWTDGASYIAVEKKMLKQMDGKTDSGYHRICLLLLHEYLHDQQDIHSHSHDFEFMESFHNIALDVDEDIIGATAKSLKGRYLVQLEGRNLPMPPNADEVQEVIYKLHLSNGKLSKQARCILKWLDKPFKVREGFVELNLGTKGFSFGLEDGGMLKPFYRVAKRHNSHLKNFRYYLSLHGNYKKGLNAYSEAVANELSLSREAKASKLTTETIKAISTTRDIEGLLTQMCSFECFGVDFVINSHKGGNVSYTFSDKVRYKHSIYIGDDVHMFSNGAITDDYLQTHSRHLDFPSSKQKRLSYVKEIIRHAFAGIKNDEERNEFIAQLININERNQFAS